MQIICNNNARILRSQLLILGVAAFFALTGCGESGSGDDQPAQDTSDAGSMAPEALAPTVSETPAMPEPEMSEATPAEEPAAPEPESMSEAPAETTEDMTAATDEAKAVAQAEEEAKVDGRQVYYTYCAVCHKAGLNAAPKYGNKALWAKRIAQGREVMYKNAIEGLRGMPPRGGIASLSDEEVKAATDFMVKGSGGWNDS